MLILSDVYVVSNQIDLKAAETIRDILHQLASPEINGPLTYERAKEMIQRLSP